jgi:hypothetical protein
MNLLSAVLDLGTAIFFTVIAFKCAGILLGVTA